MAGLCATHSHVMPDFLQAEAALTGTLGIIMGGGAGGVNMLMALVGLLALSLGSTILAIGRKSSRR